MKAYQVGLMGGLLLGSSLVATAAATPYGSMLCNEPGYQCFVAKRGATWEKLFPNPEERDLVKRLNRVNIQPYPGMKFAVPLNLKDLTVMDIAPFKRNIGPQSQKVIVVDPNFLAWGAFDENGDLVKWGPASTGKGWCPDTNSYCKTPSGSFMVYRKGSAECKSTKYPIPDGGAPMPHCMFFKGGFALHGSYEVPGFNASHGCVRMYVEDAEWLNKNFVNQPGNTKTEVYVKYYEPLARHQNIPDDTQADPT